MSSLCLSLSLSLCVSCFSLIHRFFFTQSVALASALTALFPTVKRRAMPRYNYIKYIVGGNWTCNLTSPRCNAQPLWYEHVFIYNVLEILSVTPIGTRKVSNRNQSSPKSWCKMIPIDDDNDNDSEEGGTIMIMSRKHSDRDVEDEKKLKDRDDEENKLSIEMWRMRRI